MAVSIESPGRFGVHLLEHAPDAPRLAHFYPDETGFDRYGNKMRSSRDLAYVDNERVLTKAGLLISPTGQAFLQGNPSFLHDLDIELSIMAVDRYHTMVLFSDTKLQSRRGGAQSDVFFFESDPPLAIKVRDSSSDISQPYVNEMLQTQELTREFDRYLQRNNFGLQRFLFASSMVSATIWEHGTHTTEQELSASNMTQFCTMAEEYIFREQKKGNHLWDHIYADHHHIEDFDLWQTGDWRDQNFVTRPDGKIIWVDPFFYDNY